MVSESVSWIFENSLLSEELGNVSRKWASGKKLNKVRQSLAIKNTETHHKKGKLIAGAFR